MREFELGILFYFFGLVGRILSFEVNKRTDAMKFE
jgi:hypothetical protein